MKSQGADMNPNKLYAITTMLMCLLVSACAPATQPAALFAPGTYTATKTTVAGLSGATLSFSGDGKYSVSNRGLLPIKGTYEVMQDQVVFTETEGGDAHCIGIPGKYKWAFDGETLKLASVEDQCGLRRISWPFVSWVKQP
jgi:hypothetical protein